MNIFDMLIHCFVLQISQELLAKAANPNSQDVMQFSPLHIAANFGHDKVIFLVHTVSH